MEGRGAAASASSRRPPVPARTEKHIAEKTPKSECRTRDFQQARTSVSSSSLPKQQQLVEERGTRRTTLSIHSRSLNMRSVSPGKARRAGLYRQEDRVGGVSEQMDPQSASMCDLARRVELEVRVFLRVFQSVVCEAIVVLCRSPQPISTPNFAWRRKSLVNTGDKATSNCNPSPSLHPRIPVTLTLPVTPRPAGAGK